MNATDDTIPQWLQQLYPFAPHYYQTGSGRLHYVDEGQGRPVVFLHGNPSWSFLWRDLIRDLAPQRRCLALDHLGCGLSAKPDAPEYTLQRHIERTTDWIRSLNLGEFDLVVHDWGGAIGMGAALNLREQVGRLVITNTAAFLSPHIPRRIALCRIPLLGRLWIQGCNGFAWPATFMAVTKKMDPAVKAGFLYPYSSWSQRRATARFVEDIPMHRSHPSYPVLAKIDQQIGCFATHPMLIFWGERDFCFNHHFREEWQRRFPTAQVIRNPEAGHYVLEDTGAAGRAAIVDFLSGS